MARYWKLKGRMGPGVVKTFLIESDGQFKQTKVGETLTGVVVARDGDRKEPTEIVMAAREDVISLRPYEMDLRYCWLVPEGKASKVDL